MVVVDDRWSAAEDRLLEVQLVDSETEGDGILARISPDDHAYPAAYA